MTWTKPATNGTTITGYRVAVLTTATSPVSTKTLVGATPTSTTITSLTAGDKYHVTVVAKAATNSSASTKSATFTARTKPATPAAPTTPALTVGNKEVGVHWIKPATNGTALTHFVIEALSPTTTVLATKTVGVVHRQQLSSQVLQTITPISSKSPLKMPPGRVHFPLASSPSVTPHTKPTKPTGVTGVAGPYDTALVTWTKPATNGTTITGYRASVCHSDITGFDQDSWSQSYVLNSCESYCR